MQEDLSGDFEGSHNYGQANNFQRAKVTVMRTGGGLPSKSSLDSRKPGP